MNSFGFGGANAHAILEWNESLQNPCLKEVKQNDCNDRKCVDGMEGNKRDTELVSKVFILRAKDEQACQRMATNLRNYLVSVRSKDERKLLGDLAYTLASRRSMLPYALSYSAASLLELNDALKSNVIPTFTTAKPRLGLVFTGQGSQWYAMGRELIDAYPVFRSAILNADEHIKEMGAQWSLMGW